MNLAPLKADTIRKKGKYKSRYVLSGYFNDRTFRPMVTLRLCQATRNWKQPARLFHLFFRYLHKCACNRAGIDLPWKTKIGGGFAITHGWGMVVNGNATIGRNVTFFNGVTIGQRDRIARDGSRTTDYPVIEDEVWVGPLSIIVGGVTIGRGARIAGGSFVADDIPPYSIASGNPAVVVKSGATPDVKNPAPL
jgi:serine O-acetyltransferase